jgi:hypothetical protein
VQSTASWTDYVEDMLTVWLRIVHCEDVQSEKIPQQTTNLWIGKKSNQPRGQSCITSYPQAGMVDFLYGRANSVDRLYGRVYSTATETDYMEYNTE